MKSFFVLLLSLLPILFAEADVVRYQDSAGKLHYVDSPEKVPEQYRGQLKDAPPLRDITKVSAGTFEAASEKNPEEPSRAKRGGVEIFVTSWCPHCTRLEEYLTSKRIPFKKYDIEKSSEGRKAYMSLGGGGVPIMKIGTKVIRGFQQAALHEEFGP